MKKILMLSSAFLLLICVRGHAATQAYFGDGELIRVVYNLSSGTGTEFATDLGSVASVTAPITTDVTYDINNFSLSTFGGATWNQLYVAYYSVMGSMEQAWTSGPTTGTQTGSYSNFNGFEGSADAVDGQYYITSGGTTSGGGGPTATLLQSNPNSYWNQLDYSGLGVGQMDGFLPNGDGEANLASLATVGYVDQMLYYYDVGDNRGRGQGATVATIRTFADGHTELISNSTGNNCAATLSSSFVLQIPIVTYNGQAYSGALQYNLSTQAFTLISVNTVSDTSPFASCSPSTLSSNLQVYIPVVIYGGESYWGTLQYTNGANFTVLAVGQN